MFFRGSLGESVATYSHVASRGVASHELRIPHLNIPPRWVFMQGDSAEQALHAEGPGVPWFFAQCFIDCWTPPRPP